MLARVLPTIFSKPGTGRLVWITSAPAYMDRSFSRGLIGVVGVACALCERQEVHGVVFPVDARVGGVFYHADDLMGSIHAGLAGPGKTKAMADGVALAEELLDEFLVDDGDGRRIQRVLRREAAAHDDAGADGVEVLRGAFHPGCAFVQVRIALNLYARSPVVLLHRRVGGEADFDNAGNGMEAVNDGLVQRLDLCVLVAGRLRIDVGDVAVGCIQFHVHVLGLVEALRKESRGNEQHEGERGLQDNECALQEGCSVGGGTRVGAQGFNGLRARGHQRRRKAKEDSGNERKRKGKADDRAAKAKQ